jgi:glycosyltransferase involved in cell wall biosynthesis
MSDRVALVATVLDEAGTIRDLLKGIDEQTRPPDEVLIVDGGSTDGTFEELERWAEGKKWVEVLSIAGANIASGRNAAISKTSAPIIAVTDAGARPEPGWLRALTAPLVEGRTEVAMGFYRPRMDSAFQRITSCLNIPDADEVSGERFMPSSRSIAFRREVWEKAGGYPEWLDVGEDMYFNFRVLEAGFVREFVPGAVVTWALRSDLRGFLRQYYRYARGDGLSTMYPHRHALRFGAYSAAAAVAAAAIRRPVLWSLPGALSVAWLAPSYARAWRRLRPTEKLLAAPALPLLHAAMDLAKMAGYTAGILRRATRSRR